MSRLQLPLIVTYRTIARSFPEFPLEIKVPGNYTKPESIEKYIAEEKAKCKLEDYPYTSELAEVIIFDPLTREHGEFKLPAPVEAPAEKGDKKKATKKKPAVATRPLCLELYDFFMEDKPKYGRSWTRAGERENLPEYYFVGFNPSFFLKVLGLSCAQKGKPLPADMWIGNSDHRDLGNLIVPSLYQTRVPIDLALRELALGSYTPFTPGQDVEADLSLAVELVSTLGLIDQDAVFAFGAEGPQDAPDTSDLDDEDAA